MYRIGHQPIVCLDRRRVDPYDNNYRLFFIILNADGCHAKWIDTCCIDKTSSAELTEAINSMFNWYRDAQICYAYLQDVENDEDPSHPSSTFSRSRWFTRGWTLQELIAPPKLLFLSKDWREIGSRSDLVDVIADITSIDKFLFEYGILGRYSTAQRMSWASRRKTTRVEDQAYCLLGLFGVNMPLLYGEGQRAFVRLQEEIMKHSDDHSIFAWSLATVKESGMLATSPSDFSNSGTIVKAIKTTSSLPYSITNRGIQITLPVIKPGSNFNLPFIPFAGANQHGAHGVRFALTPTATLAILNCQSSTSESTQIGIYLERSHPEEPYYRSDHSLGLLTLSAADIAQSATVDTILVRASDSRDQKPLWPNLDEEQLVILKSLPSPAFGFRLTKTLPTEAGWLRHESGVISVRLSKRSNGPHQERAVLLFQNEAGCAFCLLIEPGHDWLLTDLRVNLSDANIQHLQRDFIRDRTIELEKHKVCRREQETGSVLPVIVSVETLMKHHGALIWIWVNPKLGASPM
jgi:hypothetical protein